MSKLIEVRDFKRVTEWTRQKLKYNSASIARLFAEARKRGAARYREKSDHKKIFNNLQTAFGGENRAGEFEEIGRRYCEYLSVFDISLLWPRLKSFTEVDKVSVEGLDRLEAALERGNGAILLIAHFGYPKLVKHLLRKKGYGAWLVGPKVLLKPKEEYSRFADFMFNRVIKMPVFRPWIDNDLEAGLNVRPLVEKLKANEVLVITGDGLRATKFVDVTILGQKLPFPTGSSSLMRSTGAAVLPAFVIDSDDNEIGMKMVIEPALDYQKTSNPTLDAQRNLQKFADVFERYIRKHPHLYRWGKSNYFKKRMKYSKLAIDDRLIGNFGERGKHNRIIRAPAS